MKQVGIYKLSLEGLPFVYIGSSIDIATRCKEHKRHLRLGTHHNYKLQNDFNMWCVYNGRQPEVEHEVLMLCLPEDLDWYELMFMHVYNSVRDGYNATYDTGRDSRYRSVSKRYR